MRKPSDTATAFLNEIGGEPLEGSGFEQEIPDPSFERIDPSPTKAKRQRSERKEERGNAE